MFDVDDANQLDFVIENCGRTPSICRTPRGGYHLHYRPRKGVTVNRRVRIREQAVDLLTKESLSIIPHSVNEAGVPYTWLGEELLPLSELPVAKVGWTRERTRRQLRVVESCDDADVMARRARAYVACIEGAIAGQRGHDRTFRVARWCRSLV